MLFRFCLYGFLKNQRYYEPFLLPAFLAKGLGFFEIGLLIGFRELCTNLLEIPSGVAADIWGRRRSLAFSFLAYMTSFALFAYAHNLPTFFLAMLCYALGDAFRSGTHKAMIFAWLRKQDREDERTHIYGLTRSWSKLGSALSVVLGAVYVFLSDDFTDIFLLASIPCLFSAINILTYPADLEGDKKGASVTALWVHLRTALRGVFARGPLRRLVLETAAFGGQFISCKDYLQPLLAGLALTATLNVTWASEWSETQRGAVFIGVVFFFLYLGSAWASRRAQALVAWSGGPERAGARLWLLAMLLYGTIALSDTLGITALAVVAFVVLHVSNNFWRPIMVGRIDAYGDADYGALTMSVESQSKKAAAMVLAPLIGFLTEITMQGSSTPLWPLGLVGFVITLGFFIGQNKARP